MYCTVLYLNLLLLLWKLYALQTISPDTNQFALVKSKGLTVGLTSKDSYRNPRPVKPLWRKREIVKQERTILYTTVDAEGNVQVGSEWGRGGAVIWV